MSLCKLLVILLILSLLLLFTTIIIKYFNKIEEFTTIYGSKTTLSGKYGITCSQCNDGQEPNRDSTGCQDCPAGHAGTGGTCTPCPDGQEPNSDSTECLNCPNGLHHDRSRCYMRASCQNQLALAVQMDRQANAPGVTAYWRGYYRDESYRLNRWVDANC